MRSMKRLSASALALLLVSGCNSLTTGGTSSDNFLESTTQTSATARVNDTSKPTNFLTASGDAALSVSGGTIPRASKISVSQKKRTDFSTSDQATLSSILGTSASTELETSQADLAAGGGGTTSGFRVRQTGTGVTFSVKMRAGNVTAGFPCTAGNGFLSQIVGTTATTLTTGTSVSISAVKSDGTGQYQEFTGSSTSINWQPTRFILSFSCSVVAAPSPSPSPSASASSAVFAAVLNGTQETPAVTTSATGSGFVTLSADGTKATFSLSTHGLSGSITGAHIHQGAVGTAGSIVKNFTIQSGNSGVIGTWTSTDASQPLTSTLATALRDGQLYMNVHTAANTGGEIRGQITAASLLTMTVLTGAEETPAVTSSLQATGFAVLSTDETQIRYALQVPLNLNSTITAAHFHQGAVGAAGSVVKNITLPTGSLSSFEVSGIWTTTDASQPLTSALVTALKNGQLYLNIHSSANPNGEVRGQLTAGNLLSASLNGAQETPAVTTNATGAGLVAVKTDGTQALASLEFSGLSGSPSAAHIHQGAVGTAGSVVKNMTLVGSQGVAIWLSTDTTQPLTSALATSLRGGGMYMNVHTQANPNGEIRGQITTQ